MARQLPVLMSSTLPMREDTVPEETEGSQSKRRATIWCKAVIGNWLLDNQEASFQASGREHQFDYTYDGSSFGAFSLRTFHL